MAKHTPGPWRTAKRFPRRVTTHEGVMIGNAILANSGRSTFKSESEAGANARLISAAPDLLEALKDLRTRFHRACITLGSDPEYVALTTPDADAAIAKAEGSL